MNTDRELAPSDMLAGFGDLEGLRKLAVGLVRDDADADDVVQESLLLGLRRAGGRVRDLGAWLRGVVRNKARESRRATARREARESEARPGIVPMQPIDIAARLEVHDELVAAVKSLAEPYRSAVWLHYVEGREPSDLARDLGTPVETVRTRIKRGIVRLREDLDRRHGGKRAAWISSLAAFAGVKPSASLLAATAAGAASALKPVALAAVVVLAVAGAAAVGLPLLFPKAAKSPITPVPPAREHDALVARSADAGDSATGTAGAGEAASARPADRGKIATTPFPGDPAPVQEAPAAAANEGTFSFHYRQGFSFASRTVTDDVESADLVFQSAAGGISSVTLEAPGGAITDLERFLGRIPGLRHAEALAGSIMRAEKAVVGSSTTATGDDREPTSDAFLVRTRGGSYVALAIVTRAYGADWTKRPVTIRYAMNETEPVFHQGSGDLTVGGIEVDSQMAARLDAEAERAYQARIEPFTRRLAELDRKAAAMEPAVQARDGADVRVAAVLDREFAGPMGGTAAYIVSTYSFEKATRDDVKATRNDWDFLFESRLRVRTVVDDRSLVWDLGDASYGSARSGNVGFVPGGEYASVAQDRLYAIHTVDSDTDQWALMRVEELVAGESMIFSWVVLKDTAALIGVLESRDAVMTAPVARLQIRGGAGGGNPFRAPLDRSDQPSLSYSETPLDLVKPLDSKERHTAYVSGGKVPAGMIFMVERIEYVARVAGDSNGHGEFILWVGSYPVAHVREDRFAGPQSQHFRWFGLDRGDQPLTVDAMPVRGDLSVAIPIARGEEDGVYAEIANSSWADVTLSGRFVPASQNPQAVKRARPDDSVLGFFERVAATADAAELSRIAASINPQLAPLLRSALESIPPGPWRDKVKSVLDQVGR